METREKFCPAYFRSRDLHESAFLLYSLKKPPELENTGSTIFFVFPDYEKCLSLTRQFWGRKASVIPLEFIGALGEIKGLFFSYRREHGLV